MKYLFLILIGFFFQAAHAGFEPPVIIDPPNPTTGDTIRVGLFKEHYYPCLILPIENLDGQTHLFDFDNSLPQYPDNHIDLNAVWDLSEGMDFSVIYLTSIGSDV